MTQRTVFRFLLVGLPIGLAASLAVAVYLYYHPLDLRFPGRPARPQAADLLRKSPTAADLQEYRRLLSTELPDRSGGSPAALDATANWVGSTLGPTNIGLPVKSQNLGTTASTGRNILIELPGRRATSETVVLCTAYDGEVLGFDSATSTAVLMTLANAFVGLPQRRTLVFAFLCRDDPPSGSRSGVETLVAGLLSSGRTVRGVIDLRVVAVPPVPPGSPSKGTSLRGWSESMNDSWANEAWQALVSRHSSMASLERLERSGLTPPDPGIPGLDRLDWWGQAPPAVPFLLLVLHPPAPGDAESGLALARSLEGVAQSLANQ